MVSYITFQRSDKMTDPQIKVVLYTDWNAVTIKIIVQGAPIDAEKVAEAACKAMAMLNPSWAGP